MIRNIFSANAGLRASLCRISSSCSIKTTSHTSSLQNEADSSSEINVEGLFTEQHNELRRSLNKIIDQDINPNVDQWEKNFDFPAHEVFRKLGSAGFLGVNKPTEFGGLGLDYSYTVAVSEELGNINCGAIPMAVGVQMEMATPALARFGSDKLRQEFLVPAIKGEMVTCIGVSEAVAGSDVASIQTKAEKKGGDYVINGSKLWITNSFQADWMCLLANTGSGPKHLNKSLIIVPMNTKGVHRARKISKIGMHSSDTGEIFFEDVRVPQSHLIGEEGNGFLYQMLQFQQERMYAAISVLKPLQKAINSTIEYTRERKAFGQSLLNNQLIHFRLAELQTELESLKSMVYRATGKFLQGEDITLLASMCKLKAGRLGREITDSCLQYWGGMGYTNDVLISRMFRDMRIVSIGGGADEIMLGIISKYMGTLPRLPSSKS